MPLPTKLVEALFRGNSQVALARKLNEIVDYLAGVPTVPSEGSDAVVASLSVTPSLTLVTGQQATLTPTAYDFSGTVLTGVTFTYTSLTPAVASVTSLGVVTAGATLGSAQIIVSAGGRSATVISTTIAAGSVTQITGLPPTFGGSIGASGDFSAVARDASNNVVTSATITWTSSAPSIASVTDTGTTAGVGHATVSLLAEGTATITAHCGAIEADMVVTVETGPGSPYSSPNALSTELYNMEPGLYTPLSATLESRYGRDENGNVLTFVDVNVANLGDPGANASALQTQINTALGLAQHTRIKLGSGFISTPILITGPNTQGNYWLYIEPADKSFLPAEGARIDEASMGPAPIIQTATSGVPAVGFRPGGVNRVRFTGVHIRPASTLSDWVDGVGGDQIFSLVLIEARDAVDATHGELADMPDLIQLDRCWVNGGGGAKNSDRSLVQHAVMFNCKRFACVDSVVGGNWLAGIESHAMIGRSTQGPLKFVNNKIWGGSICLFFGGADPFVTNLMPEDVEVRRNWMWHPDTWIQAHPSYSGVNRRIKNNFEIKYGRRYLVEANVIEGCEQGWQNGQAISIKVENSGGAMTLAETKDVTLRYNEVKKSAGFLWLQGFDYATLPGALHLASSNRIEIAHNVAWNLGGLEYGVSNRMTVVTVDPFNCTIHHNTVVPARSNVSASMDILLTSQPGERASNIAWKDNIFAGETPYGLFGDGGTTGTSSLNTFVVDGSNVPNWTYVGNVEQLPGDHGPYPASNSYPLTTADIAFANLAGGDFHLTTNYLTASSTGGEPGADIDAVNTAVTGVRTS